MRLYIAALCIILCLSKFAIGNLTLTDSILDTTFTVMLGMDSPTC